MARLIIVEDYRPLATVIASVMRREGREVVLCHCVSEALHTSEVFDHAILDVDLPDGNGVHLAEELISQRRVQSVVFFTASRDRDILARATRVGLVVDKAAGCDRLVAAVNQLEQPANYRLAAIAGSPATTAIGVGNVSGTRRRID